MTNIPRSSAPRPVDPAQRRQRNALIGLGVGAGLVLLIGIVAAVATRDPGSTAVPTTFSTIATTVPTSSSAPATSEPPATTIETTTTLPVVVDAVADAGPDLAVTAGDVVTLSAVEVTEGADDAAVIWRQTAGPDVTAGVGALGGRTVSFGAPVDVVTLEFDLVVSSADRAASAPEAVDALTIRVFDDAEQMLFVDGERGDDAAVGSMENPLRSLGAAARAAEGRDLYVRSIGVYAEAETIRLGPGSSVYGGFDADWKRDRSQRVRLDGSAVALVIVGDGDRTIGSIELTAAAAGPGGRSIGVRVIDGETVAIVDSRILSGAGGEGTVESDAGVSAGVVAVETGEIRIERSTVNASDGGVGASGEASDEAGVVDVGDDGEDADAREAGGGANGTGARGGGDGGRGGETGDGADASGSGGGVGGTAGDPDGRAGRGGAGGVGGVGGDGGQNRPADAGAPTGAPGSSGGDGEPGTGGAGGGGGFGPLLVSGGGGGGGGAGADASSGGAGGAGGGGSIGVWAVDVNRVVVSESLVAAGRGGSGGPGGQSASAARGGAGGSGAPGANGFVVGDGGAGGGAGGGGAGGAGGQGGGGAGGPSYGLLTSGVDDVEVLTSTVRGGAGGSGADGGLGGDAGSAGNDGSGRNGGEGGMPGAGERSAQGAGASGGSSFGWFDVDGARQTLDEAEFIEGNAGPGGVGSSPGSAGVQAPANVGGE